MSSAQDVSRALAFRTVFLCLALVSSVGIAAPQTTKQGQNPNKKSPSITASKRVPPKASKPAISARGGRTTAGRQGASASSRARPKTRKVVVTRKLVHGRWVRTTQIVHTNAGPVIQAHPEPERYQQIQQALSAKGYFRGEVNGIWGDDSVSALKHFQTDHKITNDGKISALSLIGLGLGPNRETASSATTAAEPSHN